MTELRNVKTAKEMYRQMKQKFGWDTPGGAAATASPANLTPSKVNKRVGKVGTKSASKAAPKGCGKKVAKKEDDEEGEAVEEDPYVVLHEGGKAIVKTEVEDEDDEGV